MELFWGKSLAEIDNLYIHSAPSLILSVEQCWLQSCALKITILFGMHYIFPQNVNY